MKVFKELYNYRELLKTNIKKEIRGKYKGSWLGVIWTFLNPLLMLAIYAIVFPHILRVDVENYTIFMIVALIPWNFFTTAIQTGTNSVVRTGDLENYVLHAKLTDAENGMTFPKGIGTYHATDEVDSYGERSENLLWNEFAQKGRTPMTVNDVYDGTKIFEIPGIKTKYDEEKNAI